MITSCGKTWTIARFIFFCSKIPGESMATIVDYVCIYIYMNTHIFFKNHFDHFYPNRRNGSMQTRSLMCWKAVATSASCNEKHDKNLRDTKVEGRK